MNARVVKRVAFLLAVAALPVMRLASLPSFAAGEPESGARQPLAETGPLTQQEFERLHERVRPPDVEAWRSIPWETSIVQAMQLAHVQKKPLVMITTNGHLLGCG